MIHQMRLHKKPFEKIKNGEKNVEIRLYDAKRKLIMLNDEIEFLKRPDLKEKIKVRVVDILLCKDFSDLIDNIPEKYLGCNKFEKTNLKKNIYEYYSKEDENKYGVLGIKFKKEVNKNTKNLY